MHVVTVLPAIRTALRSVRNQHLYPPVLTQSYPSSHQMWYWEDRSALVGKHGEEPPEKETGQERKRRRTQVRRKLSVSGMCSCRGNVAMETLRAAQILAI